LRLAISGAHSTGKSTLIAAFLDRSPGYRHEPEAFELLGDDVELSDSEGPTADGLQALLEHTISALTPYGAGAESRRNNGRGQAPFHCIARARTTEGGQVLHFASRTPTAGATRNDKTRPRASGSTS